MTTPKPGGAVAKRAAERTPGPRQARAVRTRALVLEAAAQLFARRGFQSVTIQDIAELAGATKGAVYFHFANKEAMAVELVHSFYTAATRQASELVDPKLEPLEAVRELTRATGRSLRDEPVAQAAVRLQAERVSIDVDLPLPFVDYIAFISLLLTRAADAGLLPAHVEPAALARTLVSSFFGVQHVSWILNDRADIVERIDELLDLLLPS
ncbi:TetR family transcriptional regulator [Kitasatospora sp. NE20-6]|uniref:ScbR family autoregulator-binding transcription factor n=1 Tax=Kitasatospora sp. NE20-6 TaxID=2859066 RepID=UPI0034DCA259